MRERRKQLGLSQQELARLLGLPQSKISELECDVRSDMLLSTARHVAHALHMSLDELAGEDGTVPVGSSPTAPVEGDGPGRSRGRPRKTAPAPAGASG
jgi:transcriptional regulator with XRE-family HTH domain